MKKLYILIFLIFLFLKGYSQSYLHLSVTHLKVSNVSIKDIDENNILDTGPYLLLTCEIKNNTNKTLELNPGETNYFLSFNYKNKEYTNQVFPLAFMDEKYIELLPGKKVTFSVGDEIFLGKSFYDPMQRNYSNELIEILPTLTLTYVDQEYDIRLESCGIKHVKLND